MPPYLLFDCLWIICQWCQSSSKFPKKTLYRSIYFISAVPSEFSFFPTDLILIFLLIRDATTMLDTQANPNNIFCKKTSASSHYQMTYCKHNGIWWMKNEYSLTTSNSKYELRTAENMVNDGIKRCSDSLCAVLRLCLRSLLKVCQCCEALQTNWRRYHLFTPSILLKAAHFFLTCDCSSRLVLPCKV